MRQPYHRPSLRSLVSGYLYTSPSRALPHHAHRPPHITRHVFHTSHYCTQETPPRDTTPPLSKATTHPSCHTSHRAPSCHTSKCDPAATTQARRQCARGTRMQVTPDWGATATVGGTPWHPPTPRARGTRITPTNKSQRLQPTMRGQSRWF